MNADLSTPVAINSFKMLVRDSRQTFSNLSDAILAWEIKIEQDEVLFTAEYEVSGTALPEVNLISAGNKSDGYLLKITIIYYTNHGTPLFRHVLSGTPFFPPILRASVNDSGYLVYGFGVTCSSVTVNEML